MNKNVACMKCGTHMAVKTSDPDFEVRCHTCNEVMVDDRIYKIHKELDPKLNDRIEEVVNRLHLSILGDLNMDSDGLILFLKWRLESILKRRFEV